MGQDQSKQEIILKKEEQIKLDEQFFRSIYTIPISIIEKPKNDEATCDNVLLKLKDVKNTKILKNETGSKTAQMFTKFDNQNSFVKMFAKIENQNGLFVESLFYNTIIQTLLIESTPFLVAGYKFLECSDLASLKEKLNYIEESLPKSQKKFFSDRVDLWFEKFNKNNSLITDDKKIFINITQAITNSKSLISWIFENLILSDSNSRKIFLKKDQVSQQEIDIYKNEWYNSSENSLNNFTCILFQIIYTLWCFDLIGIRHNDIHLYNFLIEKLDSPKEFYFDVTDPKSSSSNKEIIKMKTNFKIYFFDWDHGAITQERGINKIITNSVLQDYEINKVGICPRYGCNEYNQGFDIAFFLCQISSALGLVYLKNKEFQSLFEPKVLKSLLLTKSKNSNSENIYFELEDSIFNLIQKIASHIKILDENDQIKASYDFDKEKIKNIAYIRYQEQFVASDEEIDEQEGLDLDTGTLYDKKTCYPIPLETSSTVVFDGVTYQKHKEANVKADFKSMINSILELNSASFSKLSQFEFKNIEKLWKLPDQSTIDAINSQLDAASQTKKYSHAFKQF